ncbi:MAG: cytochrome c3 family protein, partial [Dehalococcoidales bacterium]|nr:cytochrome c3 family protein [Dehalococcoidales bacterium]
CHEDVVKKGAAVAYRHVPFAQGNCKACHLPHASNYAALKPVDTKQLCLATCHSDRALNMDFSHTPVARGQCTSCHRPHGSENPRMLIARGTSLCLTCHPK